MMQKLRFRRLPTRYAAIVMPALLAAIMTCIVSCISTLRGVGVAPDFFSLWMQAWGLSYVIAFPVLLIVLPLVRRIVSMVVETGH